MNELLFRLRQFNQERDWEQFHSPKNLAMGLVTEAAEVLELFLWRSDAESTDLTEESLASLRSEIGDVQLYLLNLADKFGLDPVECASQKLEVNATNYPVHKARGSATKYTKLGP